MSKKKKKKESINSERLKFPDWIYRILKSQETIFLKKISLS